MSVKNLIDSVRKALEAEGFRMKLHAGRDRIASVFFNKAYSAAIAAEDAGKLPPLQIFEAGLQDIQAKYGVQERELVARLCRVFLNNPDNPSLQGHTMKVTEQIAGGFLPQLPQLTFSTIENVRAGFNDQQKDVTAITLNPFNFRHGKHFQCVKAAGNWYALYDGQENGSPMVTAQWNGSVLYVHDDDGFEGDHEFMTWVFDGGQWLLEAIEHSMIDDNEMDDTLEEVRQRGMEPPAFLR